MVEKELTIKQAFDTITSGLLYVVIFCYTNISSEIDIMLLFTGQLDLKKPMV